MKNVLKVWKQIYKNQLLVTLQIVLFGAGLILISYIQNIGQIHSVIKYSIPLEQRLILVQKIILYFYTDNISFALLVMYLAITFLFSYNIILTCYYFNKRTSFTGIGSLSVSAALALLGTGCAACGGVLLTSIFSTIGAAGLVALLPYGGSEFLFLAMFFLIYSAITISKKIDTPLVCQ